MQSILNSAFQNAFHFLSHGKEELGFTLWGLIITALGTQLSCCSTDTEQVL